MDVDDLNKDIDKKVRGAPSGWHLRDTFEVCKNYYNQLNLAKKIFSGFAIPLILMIVVAIAVFQSIHNLVETAEWVQHTQEVISKGHALEKLILAMETGERGFLITGKDSFLTLFN